MDIKNESELRSIKEFALILMIISILMIIGNSSAFIVSLFLKLDMSPSDDYVYKNIGDQLFGWMTGHFNLLFPSLVIIGILFLISSINIRKHKKWSIVLVSTVAVIILINIWIFFVSMVLSIIGQNGMNIFIIIPILISSVISIPLIILIRFLNKKEIKSHFS